MLLLPKQCGSRGNLDRSCLLLNVLWPPSPAAAALPVNSAPAVWPPYSSRHQAREHSAAGRRRSGGRLRHRARGASRRWPAPHANRTQPRHADIWVVDSDGKNLRQVTSDGANNRLSRFTADRRLVFYSNRTGTYQAFRINTDGCGVEPLTAFASGLITYPQLSRDGLTLLFADSSRAAAEATGPWPASRTQVRPLSRAVVDGIPITPLSYSPDERYSVGNRWDPSLRRLVALAVYDRTQQRAWALPAWPSHSFWAGSRIVEPYSRRCATGHSASSRSPATSCSGYLERCPAIPWVACSWCPATAGRFSIP